LLKKIIASDETAILYESPHRILKTLKAMSEHMPNSQIVVARELTKVFEEFVRGTPGEVLTHFGTHPAKGEFVIIIGPSP
jgi:16S rRNA (cytidine1402-2'-O)-methyltransferase